MTPFVRTTLLSLGLILALSWLLPAPASRWAVAGIVILELTLCAIGVTRIGWQFYCPAICSGDSGKRQIALTFDDGPDPAVTPELLDWLSNENIRANFFCIGKNIEKHPALAKRIVDGGHLIGNHFYTHGWWTPFLFTRGLIQEIDKTQKAIRDATGVDPVFARPPVGLTNPHFRAALTRTGLKLVGWNLRTFDTSATPEQVIERISRNVGPGSIIVLHDAKAPPEKLLQILRTVVPKLRADGFEFVRIDAWQ